MRESAVTMSQVALDSVVDIRYGKGMASERRTEFGKFPYVTSSGHVDFVDRSLIAEDTIVVGRKGNAGSVRLVRGGCWPSDTTFYLTRKSSTDDFSFGFLFLCLESLSLRTLEQSSAVPGLARPALAKVLIPAYRPAAQRRIVDLMSAADRYVAALEVEVLNSRNALTQICASLLRQGSSLTTGTWSDLVAFRRQKIVDGVANLTVATKAAGMRPSSSSRTPGSTMVHAIEVGEFVYLRQGAASGVVAIANLDGNLSVNFPVAALTPIVSREYMELLLRDPQTLSSLNQASAGTAQPFLSEKGLLSIPISYHSSPDEQHRVVGVSLAASNRLLGVQGRLLLAKHLRDQLLHDLLSDNHIIPETYDSLLGEST